MYRFCWEHDRYRTIFGFYGLKAWSVPDQYFEKVHSWYGSIRGQWKWKNYQNPGLVRFTLLTVKSYRYYTVVPLHRENTDTFKSDTVASIVTLNCNGKYDCHINRHRYYHYCTLNNKALWASLKFCSRVTGIVTVFYKRF